MQYNAEYPGSSVLGGLKPEEKDNEVSNPTDLALCTRVKPRVKKKGAEANQRTV